MDNAGKTTICKAILGEDVDEVSPTLGFNIRTIFHQGYSLNVCASTLSDLSSCRPPPVSRAGASSADPVLPLLLLLLAVAGDIGGQTSLRPYWRNYFEQTDAVIWVVDSSDRARMNDCKRELHELLLEEVRPLFLLLPPGLVRDADGRTRSQRLMGASLLVFTNKQDIASAMTIDEISTVRSS